jgi:hypothetical protein
VGTPKFSEFFSSFLEKFAVEARPDDLQNPTLISWIFSNWGKTMGHLLPTLHMVNPINFAGYFQNESFENVCLLLEIVSNPEASQAREVLQSKFTEIAELIFNNYKIRDKERILGLLQKFNQKKQHIALILMFSMFKIFKTQKSLEYVDEYISFLKLLDDDDSLENMLLNSSGDPQDFLVKNSYAQKDLFNGLVGVINHLLILKNSQSSKFLKILGTQRRANKENNTLNQIFSEKSVLALDILEKSGYAQSDKILSMLKQILQQRKNSSYANPGTATAESQTSVLQGFSKILAELNRNVESGLETVFTELQNCFIMFEENDPYDDALISKKVVLKTNQSANVGVFIAALSVKESLQNFEIFSLLELLEDKFERSEYLSGLYYNLKRTLEYKEEKNMLESVHQLRASLKTEENSDSTFIVIENFFESFSSLKKKSNLVRLTKEFSEKTKYLKSTAVINEISIIGELTRLLEGLKIFQESPFAVRNKEGSDSTRTIFDVLGENQDFRSLRTNLENIQKYAENIDIFDNKNIVKNIRGLAEQEIGLLELLLGKIRDRTFVSLLDDKPKGIIENILGSVLNYKNLLREKKLRSVKVDSSIFENSPATQAGTGPAEGNSALGDLDPDSDGFSLKNFADGKSEINFAFEGVLTDFLNNHYEDVNYEGMGQLTITLMNEIVSYLKPRESFTDFLGSQTQGAQDGQELLERISALFEEVVTNGQIIFFADLLIPFIKNAYLVY